MPTKAKAINRAKLLLIGGFVLPLDLAAALLSFGVDVSAFEQRYSK